MDKMSLFLTNDGELDDRARGDRQQHRAADELAAAGARPAAWCLLAPVRLTRASDLAVTADGRAVGGAHVRSSMRTLSELHFLMSDMSRCRERMFLCHLPRMPGVLAGGARLSMTIKIGLVRISP